MVDRGDVHLILMTLPSVGTQTPTYMKDKFVVALGEPTTRGLAGLVTVVLASTLRSANLRKFEVKCDTSDGFSWDTVIDCRWLFTLRETDLPLASRRFTLSPQKMHAISVAIVAGLNLV